MKVTAYNPKEPFPVSSLTKTEALARIAELQKFIAELDKPKNNHPSEIGLGMLFKHKATGELFITVCLHRAGDAWDLRCLDGRSWCFGQGFDNRKDDFIYLGVAKDKLCFWP